MMWLWAAAGLVFFIAIVFSMRSMRKGTTFLSDEQKTVAAIIKEGELEIARSRKGIQLSEQMHILHAAVADLLRLDELALGVKLELQGNKLSITGKDWIWLIRFSDREHVLRSTGQVLSGHEKWSLICDGQRTEFADLAELMSELDRRLRGEKVSLSAIGEHHLARRIGRRKSPVQTRKFEL